MLASHIPRGRGHVAQYQGLWSHDGRSPTSRRIPLLFPIPPPMPALVQLFLLTKPPIFAAAASPCHIPSSRASPPAHICRPHGPHCCRPNRCFLGLSCVCSASPILLFLVSSATSANRARKDNKTAASLSAPCSLLGSLSLSLSLGHRQMCISTWGRREMYIYTPRCE